MRAMNGLVAATAMSLLMATPLVCAQGQGAAPTPPAQPAEPKKDQPKAEPKPNPKQPTLDDLLGIPKDKPASKAKPRPEAADPTKTELDRKLSATEVAEQFKQAVDLMGETAERLQVSKDTGLGTQRLQEDILRKLDQLIKAAEQNQKQSKSSPSPSSRDPQQSQPNQQQQQRNPDGKTPAPDTAEPPAGQDAKPNPGTAARGAMWGNLPARMRDALLQSGDDRFSTLYRKWTEAYYRRLAEEANK